MFCGVFDSKRFLINSGDETGSEANAGPVAVRNHLLQSQREEFADNEEKGSQNPGLAFAFRGFGGQQRDELIDEVVRTQHHQRSPNQLKDSCDDQLFKSNTRLLVVESQNNLIRGRIQESSYLMPEGLSEGSQ